MGDAAVLPARRDGEADVAAENDALPAQGSLEEAFPSLKGASESGAAAPAAPASGAGESNDTRDRRIANGKLYSSGVASWRTRVASSTGPAEEEHGSSARARVFVRVRPLFEHEAERGEWECVSTGEVANQGVTLHEGTEMVQAGKGLVKALRHHTFAAARPLTDDDAVFGEMSRDLVSLAASGACATLFMLGMTGSGKTYNMNVIHERAPAELFAALAADATAAAADAPAAPPSIGLISYELVGKKSFDLLSDAKGEVQLRADAKGRIQVALLRAASARRETAATGANAQSSRSHAVYQISLRNGGRLLLVDLAGNEGSIETLYHSKAQMAEAAEINASLMALKTCLHARATAAPHVPFRDSTLTRVLQDALTDPKATTAVLACLSPACSHFELSVRTMGVSVTLMGRDEQARQEAETLHEVGVRRGGPATWTADELRVWLAERPFAAAVALPDGATG